MAKGRLWLVLTALAFTLAFAGCLADGEPVQRASLQEEASLVVDSSEEPVTGASFSATTSQGDVLTVRTLPEEKLSHAWIPPDADTVTIVKEGTGSWEGPADDLPALIVLEPVPKQPAPNLDEAPVLSFEDPQLLGTAHLAGHPSTCEAYNCGASEPVVEVASDGTVYVSGTCCIGESPPIWVSRDHGETFHRLQGDLLRESFGIEGDFSIDDAGNLYFTDISAANAYIASWDEEGEHRHTVPAGPFAPLVDRPWTRAGSEDVVHFFYNTARSTMYYKSTDAGITWVPMNEFDSALGTPGQGPDRSTLWVAAGGQLHQSQDAGESWTTVGEIPRPTDEGSTFQAFEVPVVDEAGNAWVIYDWSGDDEDAFDVYAARYGTDEAWHGPYQVSPANGTHHLPWGASAREGTLAVAWYGTPNDEAGPNSVEDGARWSLYAAASVDADQGEPSFQVTTPDPKPVHHGPMDRKLLDFLQVEIGPEGRLHIAYAQDRNGQPDEATMFVRSTLSLDLGPESYLNGP